MKGILKKILKCKMLSYKAFFNLKLGLNSSMVIQYNVCLQKQNFCLILFYPYMKIELRL